MIDGITYLEEVSEVDNINQPSHYQGRQGLEAIGVLRNFMTPEQLKGFFLIHQVK